MTVLSREKLDKIKALRDMNRDVYRQQQREWRKKHLEKERVRDRARSHAKYLKMQGLTEEEFQLRAKRREYNKRFYVKHKVAILAEAKEEHKKRQARESEHTKICREIEKLNRLAERNELRRTRKEARKTWWLNGGAAEYYREYKQKNYIKCRLLEIKYRARSKNIPFNLEATDIIIPDTCPILGIKLCTEPVAEMRNNWPSVDRLIPERGYIKGNVWVISQRANTLKSNATSDELFKVARAVQLIEAHLTA